MLFGLFMVLAPCIVFVITQPYADQLRPVLRNTYRIVGGFILFVGSGASIFLSAYFGDQGGISAFYFQLAVLSVFAAFTILLVVLNWFLNSRTNE